MSDTIVAIDTSNFQPADLTALIAEHQPQHVVVRLSTESEAMRQIALQQIRSAHTAGCTVSGYIWAYWDAWPVGHIGGALNTVEESGVPVTHIWIDCEDTDHLPPEKCDGWLAEAVDVIEKRGLKAGIYTGKYFWEANVADWPAFTRLPLWLAHYTNIPSLEDDLLPVGAWTKLSGKQWTDTPIDRDVFDTALFAPAPPPDQCSELKAKIRALIAPGVRLNRRKLAAVAGD